MARLIGETLTGMPARLGQSNPGVGAVAENLAVEYRDEAAGKTIQARVEEIHDSVVVLRQLSSKGPGKIILRAAYSLEKLQILDQ